MSRVDIAHDFSYPQHTKICCLGSLKFQWFYFSYNERGGCITLHSIGTVPATRMNLTQPNNIQLVNNIQLFINNYIFFFFTICLTVFLTLSAVNKPPFRKVYLLREWAIKKFLKKSQSTNLSKSISNGQKKSVFCSFLSKHFWMNIRKEMWKKCFFHFYFFFVFSSFKIFKISFLFILMISQKNCFLYN